MHFHKNSFLVILFVAVFAFLPFVHAQNTDNLTDSTVQEKTITLIQQGKYVEALPFVEELIKRLEKRPAEQQAPIPDLAFFGGLAYMQLYSTTSVDKMLLSAIDKFKLYLTKAPLGSRAHTVHLRMGDCYRGLQQWQEAAQILIKLLNTPEIRGSLTEEEREDTLKKICQSFYLLKNWEQGERWFKALLAEAKDNANKSLAATSLIEIYIKDLRYEEISKLFPYLSIDAPSRYNPGFNVALLNGARSFAQKEKIAEAAVLYYLVLTTEEMAKYFAERKAYYERQIPLIRNNPLFTESTALDKISKADFEIKKAETELDRLTNPKSKFYIKSYTIELEWLKAQNYILAGRDFEAFWAFENIYSSYPNYDKREDIVYSVFIQAAMTGFVDKAIAIGEAYMDNKNYQKFNRLISAKMAELYLKADQLSKFYKIIDQAIQKDPNDEYAEQMILLLGSKLLESGNVDSMIARFSEYLEKYPRSKVVDGSLYWLGLANLFQGKYEESIQLFSEIIRDHPQSNYYPDAEFRRAVSYYSLDDVQKAYDLFMQFTRDYPRIFLRPEAESFMGDIAAQEAWVDKAIVHYSNVERTSDLLNHPSQISFISHAALQLGKLLRANDRHEQALEVYEDFFTKHPESEDASMALYEKGLTYEEINRPGDLMRTWLRAIMELGNQPEATGVDSIIVFYNRKYLDFQIEFEQNKKFFQDMMFDEEFRTKILDGFAFQREYFAKYPFIAKEVQEALLRKPEFRKQIMAKPSVLQPYLDTYRNMEESFLEELPKTTFTREYSNALRNGKITLAFRLQMALDEMGELGTEEVVVFTRDDMLNASARSLVWMGGKMLKLGGREDAAYAYQLVIDRYPNSPAIVDAILNLAEIKAMQKEYDEAVKLYDRIVTEFSFSAKLPGAILGKADLQLLQQNFEGAREGYASILANRDYRGPYFPESMYKIGLSHQLEGNLEQAVSFFERTYFAYSGYPLWAAKACLSAGRLFVEIGNRDRAIELLQEFLDSKLFLDFYNDSDDVEYIQVYSEIQKLFNQL